MVSHTGPAFHVGGISPMTPGSSAARVTRGCTRPTASASGGSRSLRGRWSSSHSASSTWRATPCAAMTLWMCTADSLQATGLGVSAGRTCRGPLSPRATRWSCRWCLTPTRPAVASWLRTRRPSHTSKLPDRGSFGQLQSGGWCFIPALCSCRGCFQGNDWNCRGIWKGEQYCGGRLEKPTGSFKTPNWPEKDYPAGVSCFWHIVAPRNQIIEVKFEKFDVERDSYCRYDYVAIFNGAEINDAKRIGKYCGDSPPAPVFSDGSQLFIQFLSDLSLTADGFIGHYKFRPKKFSTTTIAPTTTSPLVTTRTTSLKYSAALCQQRCKKSGALEWHYCSSDFVITGTVISTVTRGGSVHASISIISVYKEGKLSIQQAGKALSTKIIILCKKCPFIRRGLSYVFMGQADAQGRGKVAPHHFVGVIKPSTQKSLNTLRSQRC
ncbi:procollagen C-endopeptidase enhancer 2-like isoform X2 [Brienomyrus brachyistius]|uniref:procollagen C-endopeptidase enhancer 2-like isoform X2 n=1 Tax=Brienomyrus brachyistius TaxID=42636 RepID=UPI0020B41EEC|nr:procollagen C-endopeptidase enhancer 2-like isoform X2 [Brienomyrus brachyistius]